MISSDELNPLVSVYIIRVKRYFVSVVIQIPQKDIVKGSSDDAGAVLTVCLLGKALCSLSVSAQSDMALGKSLNQFSATEPALLPAPLL